MLLFALFVSLLVSDCAVIINRICPCPTGHDGSVCQSFDHVAAVAVNF